MIGSNINQMVTAEKMSVDQLRQSIENGTLEGYIGIPILQAKIKEQQQAQMASQAPQEPPIAQQVMSEASGVAQLPSNIQPAQYRGGGIVGYANGGMTEDDFFLDEDDPLIAQTEEEEYLDALAKLSAAAQGISSMQNLPSKAMVSYENATPDVEREALSKQTDQEAPQAATQPSPQGGISDLIASAANRYNLPPELMQNIAGAESSGRVDAANPRSSAKGLYQFIDSTWEGLGGQPGNQFDPQENVELGAKYTRQNVDRLKGELGRSPTYAEVYAAHYFGPGVSKMLKNASPSDPIEAGLATFTSPRGVEQILDANPNLQGKTVGEVLASLESKAGEGIVELARGGTIRYADGGEVNYEDDMAALGLPAAFPQEMSPFGGMEEYGLTGYGTVPESQFSGRTARDIFLPESVKKSGYAGVPAETPRTVKPTPPVKTVDLTKPEPKTEPKQTPAPTDKQVVKTQTEMLSDAQKQPEKNLYDVFLERFEKAESNAKKQREMDAYMSLATAGFAMAGGASPNAMQNIAQGALAGMGQYAGLQKTRAAEEAAREKNLLTAQRYKELGETARATAAMTQARLTDEEQNRLRNALAKREQEFADILAKDITLIGKSEAEKQAALNNLRRQDPLYNELFKPLFGVNYGQYVSQQSGQLPNNFAGYSAKPK